MSVTGSRLGVATSIPLHDGVLFYHKTPHDRKPCRRYCIQSVTTSGKLLILSLDIFLQSHCSMSAVCAMEQNPYLFLISSCAPMQRLADVIKNLACLCTLSSFVLLAFLHNSHHSSWDSTPSSLFLGYVRPIENAIVDLWVFSVSD